jgi:hydrophobic/amphiphilic exporter-1 (mainly G- bacteria), HAE1 family
VQANHVRLRPILMTTFAIVAGLIPTALGLGAGSAQRSAIAVTIIGGQTLCLLPTLLITPVAYSVFAQLGDRQLLARAGLQLARLKLSATRLLHFLQD